jgi:hypothetical protein
MKDHHPAGQEQEQAAETGSCCCTETAAAEHKHGSTSDKPASDAKIAAVAALQKPKRNGCCGSC